MKKRCRRVASGAKKRKILIVDDHPIVRDGLALLIDKENDLSVCGKAGNAVAALATVSKTRPDLVVMDISIEGANGLEVTKAIRRKHPAPPVLVLSMHEEDIYAERALRAGASAYLTKQEPPETVLKAIRTVLGGGLYVSERVSSRLLGEATHARPGRRKLGIERFSDRELEIFELIGRGFCTTRIAADLNLSVKTVESHRANLRQKLNLGNGLALVRYATCWVEGGSVRPRIRKA